MATTRIYIKGERILKTEAGIDLYYEYANEHLRVYYDGRMVSFQRCKQGDAFALICRKGKITLKKMVPPCKKGDCVAWLLGFNKNNRAKSVEEYEKLLEEQRKRYLWEGYYEWEDISSGYVFTQGNGKFTENVNVAAFVSDAITKSEVMGLIPLMVEHHPEWYVAKILKDRFGVTEAQFEEAAN